jgi:sugar O-acyltransferase (sialic acid O-acetyltransferase NeuD family)
MTEWHKIIPYGYRLKKRKTLWQLKRMRMKMKDKLLIMGASGHGKVVADVASSMKLWKQIAFLDDDESMKQSMGFDVIGKLVHANAFINEYDIFVAVGDNKTREEIQLWIEAEGASVPLLIHPHAVIGAEVELGAGTVVMAGAVINCCTKIGKGCIINTGATVDHENLIGDFVHVSPG